MSAGSMNCVPVGSVSSVRLLQRLSQPVRRAGNYDQMDMIGHQAVTDDRHSVKFDVFSQRRQVGGTVRIAIQDDAPVISTLSQMVWHINGNHPSESSHSKETISGNRLHAAASCNDERKLI
jgi:hypothetical protein